jgi:hypothetical protein
MHCLIFLSLQQLTLDACHKQVQSKMVVLYHWICAKSWLQIETLNLSATATTTACIYDFQDAHETM